MTQPSLAMGAAAAFFASVLFLFRRKSVPAPKAAPPKRAPVPPKVAASRTTEPRRASPQVAPAKPAAGPSAKAPPKPAPKQASRVATPRRPDPPPPDLATVWSELDGLVASEPTEQAEPPATPWVRTDPELAALDDELLAPPQARGRDRIDRLLEELRRSDPPKMVVRPRLVPKRPAKRP